MESLRNNVKGKRVRITDEEGCNFVGIVEYVDHQRGKIGVNGNIEGIENSGKSMQLFFKPDIKRIVVFDDTQSVFASCAPNIKSMAESKHGAMPSGSEYKGIKYKTVSLLPSDDSSISSGLGKSVESPTTTKSDSIQSEGCTQFGSSGQATDEYMKHTGVPLPIMGVDKALAVKNKNFMKKNSKLGGNRIDAANSYPANVDVSSNMRRARNGHQQVSESRSLSGQASCSDACYVLPTTVSVGNLPVRSKELSSLSQEIRRLLWPSVTTPPFNTPMRLYFIDKEGDVFEEAISRLSSCSRIGLSMEGEVLGSY